MNFIKLFILSLWICSFNSIYGQYILAGEHSCGQKYLNFTPAQPISYPSYSLDINGDNEIDFLLIRTFDFGGGFVKYSSDITPLGTNEIVLDHTDTLKWTNCGTILKDIPKVFANNDTISENQTWKHSNMTFYFSFGYSPGSNWCDYQTNGIAGNDKIIGVRIITAIDTTYGWIKLNNISQNTLDLTESACELKNYSLPPPTISQNGNVLSSNHISGNQWFRNDTLLAGAAAQNYTMTQNGMYSLVVTENGCVSDTASINIINLSLSDHDSYPISIIPNPAVNEVTITIHSNQLGSNWELTNSIGEIILKGNFNSLVNLIKVDALANGLYFLRINKRVVKLIKQ